MAPAGPFAIRQGLVALAKNKVRERAAVATGGCLKPDEGAWHARGCKVLDGGDPKDNIVKFKQPAG